MFRWIAVGLMAVAGVAVAQLEVKPVTAPSGYKSSSQTKPGIFFYGIGGGGGVGSNNVTNGQGLFTFGIYGDGGKQHGIMAEVGAAKLSSSTSVDLFGSINYVAAFHVPHRTKDYLFGTGGITFQRGDLGFANFGVGYDLHLPKQMTNDGEAIRFEVRDYATGHSHNPVARIVWLFGHSSVNGEE